MCRVSVFDPFIWGHFLSFVITVQSTTSLFANSSHSSNKSLAATNFPQQHFEKEYPLCPPITVVDRLEDSNDIEHVLRILREAPLQNEPFNYWLFACEVWPPLLYKKMQLYLPLLHNVEEISNKKEIEQPCRFFGKCGSGIAVKRKCRREVHLDHFIRRAEQSPRSLLKSAKSLEVVQDAISTWKRVEIVLKSTALAELVWEKLGVLEQRNTVNVRLLASLPTKDPQLLHTDSPFTVASLIFPLPTSVEGEYEHGTCLHSAATIRERPKCSHQVRFLPNSVAAFRTVPSHVGGTSYSRRDEYTGSRVVGGAQTRHVYPSMNITRPSWHSAPSWKFNTACKVIWRNALFVTYPCEGLCKSRWSFTAHDTFTSQRKKKRSERRGRL
ncbi:hypothetical protein RI054_16g76550 [Pseudoscourfieldia marina]